MKRALALALVLATATSVFAQTESTAAKPKSTRHASGDIQELKDAIAAQQQQIQQLQQQIQSRDTAIQQLQQQVGQAQATATAAQQAAAAEAGKQSPESSAELTSLQHDVTDLKTLTANSAESLQDTQKRVSSLESPVAIHYKGITITPGGFLAAETVWRPHATLGDINTQLNGIPFSAAGQARQSEFYGSGRQSRLSLLAQGNWSETKLTGYYETDFLAAGVTSNNNQSNSYVLRQRQIWGQAAFQSGWSITGGQMWSLVTETKVGLDNRTEATPLTIDPQYTVGFSWARQFGFRVTKNYHNKAWLGFSVENSQEILTAAGNPTNFLLGGPGNAGGLYNPTANYSSNVSPDFVVKAAFQPGFGHYEIFAVASPFRDRIYPNATAATPSAVGAFNNNTLGGGFGANARWLMAQKHVEFGLHYLGGNGIGRYGTSGLPDMTVYGDGYLHLVRSYQGLASLEYHSPKWDLYTNAGAEYAGRQASLYKGKPVGYGSPLFNDAGCGTETLPTAANGYGPGGLSTCSGNTRAIIEGTAGFWYKPYNGPKGRLQMGAQYSYLTRDAWSGLGGQPEAIENMIFTSFRYYLP